MDYKTCLQKIIGITRSDCSCLTNLMQNDTLGTDWYKQSTSGLYLDELEGLISLFAVDETQECDTDGLSKFFTTARDNAINFLFSDYLVALNQKFKEGIRTYNGLIGSIHPRGVTQVINAFAGLRLWTTPMKGGLITINKIYAMMNVTATFNVSVYKVERNALYWEFITTIPNIQSVANQMNENTLPTPVDLELSEFGCDYYLLYEPSGFSPMQNSTSCGCGSKEYLLRQYLEVTGITGDDINMMPYFSTNSYAQGIALDVQVGCNAGGMVCTSYNLSTPTREAMAFAVRYKAGELVHEYVLRSNKINQYTMSSREFLWGKRNHFKSEYLNIINWLVDNADIDMIDCYVCNDKRVTKGGILS